MTLTYLLKNNAVEAYNLIYSERERRVIGIPETVDRMIKRAGQLRLEKSSHSWVLFNPPDKELMCLWESGREILIGYSLLHRNKNNQNPLEEELRRCTAKRKRTFIYDTKITEVTKEDVKKYVAENHISKTLASQILQEVELYR